MTNRIEEAPFSPPSLAAALSVCLFIVTLWTAVHAQIIGRKSEDDIQYLYYAATKIVDADRHAQIGQKISKFLNSDAERPYYPYRFDERQNVVGNYTLLSNIMILVRSSLQDRFSDGGTSYIQAIITIYNVSLHATLTLSLLILGATMYVVRREFLLGAALGLTALLLIDWFYPWGTSAYLLHYMPYNLTEFIERIFQTITLIFTVGGSDSPFPRGNFLILTIPVFLLRWSGRHGASYGLMVIVTVFHLSMGGLLLMSLLVTDMLLRRETLRSPVVLVMSAGALGWFLSSGLILKNAAIASSLPPIAVTLALSLFILGAIRLLTTMKSFSLPEAVVQPIRNRGPIASDLVVLYAMWFMLVPVSLFMYFRIGNPWNLWTWGELPGRYLMMLRGPLTVGAAIYLVGRLQRLGRRSDLTIALVTLSVAGGLFLYALSKPNVFSFTMSRLSEGLQAREQTASRADRGERFEYVEADIYYSLARAIDLERPFPNALLNFTAGACYRRYARCE